MGSRETRLRPKKTSPAYAGYRAADLRRVDGAMPLETKNRKTTMTTWGFGLFGVAFAVGAFCLTEEWPRRIQALLIGILNVGVAIYLKRSR